MPPTRSADAARWRRAGAALVEKGLAELSYEELLVPQPADPTRRQAAAETSARWRVDLADGTCYEFRARRGAFGSWHVEPGSVRRTGSDGTAEVPNDPVRLVRDARVELGLDAPTLAEVVRELRATQAADVTLAERAFSAKELADLDHVDLESHMTGHPCLLLSKGRLGFSAEDLRRYAPEHAPDLRLQWAAVRGDLGVYHGVEGLDQATLLAHELDEPTRRQFGEVLTRAVGGDAAEGYLWLPVHPWQWEHVVEPLFAAELADQRIVHLGVGPDRYRPLQSIRTLTNLDRPDRHNVKLPLMVRNTLVWRGLGTTATAASADVTAWLHRLRDRDPYLRDEVGLIPLGEVAAVAVEHPVYDALEGIPYRYHELLGAVWREPVQPLLRPGERARTMASLLSVDPDGRALVAELVDRSGRSAAAWLRELFAALLPGLLHYLYRYGVAFCPHGENVVVLYDRTDVPRRVAVKDFAEDVNLLPRDLPEYAELSARADAVLHRWPARELAHSILSAIGAGHLRHLEPIVRDQLGVDEPA
ncbi:MAG: IucA/IucC family protein, partial [Actinomycetota bacterium]|nr:IucA/IucC family protein [Actinomycetota bacterium]